MAKGLVEIEGFEQFLKKVKGLPDKTKRSEVQKLFTRVSLPLRRAIKVKVAPHTKTGLLKKSVGIKRGSRAPVIAVGFKPRAFHAHFIESGTSVRKTKRGQNRGAAPAFHPVENAWNENKNTLIDQSAKAVGKYIQKTIDRLSK